MGQFGCNPGADFLHHLGYISPPQTVGIEWSSDDDLNGARPHDLGALVHQPVRVHYGHRYDRYPGFERECKGPLLERQQLLTVRTGALRINQYRVAPPDLFTGFLKALE